MATQTTSRGRAVTEPKRESKRTPKAAPVPQPVPLADRLKGMHSGIRGAMPSSTMSDRARHQLYAVLFFLCALLGMWALVRGATDGPILEWAALIMLDLAGGVAFLLPLYAALAAIAHVRTKVPHAVRPLHYLGGGAFLLSATGLLSLAVDGRGGIIGGLVASLLSRGLGDIIPGILLLVIGMVAVFFLAETDAVTFVRDVRALLPQRDDCIPEALLEEPVNVKNAKSAQATAQSTAALPVVPPVINIHTQQPKPINSTSAAAKPILKPAAPGEPLPLPSIDQLAYYESVTPDTADLEAKARRIEETLMSFKVEARVREINPGPAVTQFTLEPGHGTKVRRITELQNDLALTLAAPSIRIEAPIPGMARVGIEIPNPQVATVGLRETLESQSFQRTKAKLPIPLGRDVNGRYIVGDLTKMPHLLIAGSTGSGKSVCLNGIISTFLATKSPEELKLLMIDPKMVELSGFNGVPHLQCPVVTEMDKVVGALRLVLREMERRYTLFTKLGVRNIDGYRMKVADEPGAEVIPYLVVIIDELADLMMTTPDEVETLLARLTQMARATGIHLIIATQRPSVDVLTGLIKANVPARIAFAVASVTDSRVILDMPGADRLLGRGDMLFLPPDAAKPARIQGAFIEDKDVHYIVGHWHKVAPLPQYAQEWLDLPSSNASSAEEGDGEDDPLMDQALEIVRTQGTASASMLQRRLRIGYNRAARLIEQMEEEGIIGPADGVRGRPFLAGE